MSQAIVGIQPNAALDNELLYCALTWLKPAVKALGQHGIQATLYKGVVEDLSLRLPSVPEQGAIAAVLPDMDAELEALEACLEKTRALTQGMIQGADSSRPIGRRMKRARHSMPVLRLPLSEEQLSELEGEGDLEFFMRLSIHGQQRVVYVHVRHRKFYDLFQKAQVSGAGGSHVRVMEGAHLEDE